MTKYGIITEKTGTWFRLLSESTKPGMPLLYESKEEAELAAMALNIVKYTIAPYRG